LEIGPFCYLIHGLNETALNSDDRKRNIGMSKNEACSLQILVDSFVSMSLVVPILCVHEIYQGRFGTLTVGEDRENNNSLNTCLTY